MTSLTFVKVPRLPALLTVGAGVVHLAHVLPHRDTPLFWWFFLATGLAQIALAVAVFQGRSWARWLLVSVNGALIGTYVMTRFILPPGQLLLEPVEPIGLIAKGLELSSVILFLWTLRPPVPTVIPEGQDSGLSRRQLLRASSLAVASAAAGSVMTRIASAAPATKTGPRSSGHEGFGGHFGNAAVGQVDTSRFDPMVYLREFDYGRVSKLPDGRTLREYFITSRDVEIEVAPGVKFPAWAYNGRVPGPTIRATEGDLLRVHFTNEGSHPHSMHFHGFHRANMDGVFEQVSKGGTFTYEFTAEPFGLHLYHCHTPPLKRHIHKGLYGVFIVDPPGGRPKADELVMMMNGFDTNFDGENEIYAVNTVAHHYVGHPIEIRSGELTRVYLANITEFDLVNSMHTHATFFNEYRTGTKLDPDNFTDTIILGQGERSILEFRYKDPGDYMFHAHVSEFAELGWMGVFRVKP